MNLLISPQNINTNFRAQVSKAYDRLSWDFLEKMIIRLGFDRQWVNLIMLCISSVSCSVLINERVVGPIEPYRGLRQGCPLSPFIFILCAHGLSSLILDAERRGFIPWVLC